MSRSVEAVCIDPSHAEQVWPLVSGWLRSAMKRGGLGSFNVMESDVKAGRALLWVAWDGTKATASAVTQVGLTETGKVCEIVACGGSGIVRNLSLIRPIERYAKREDCRAIRLMGRKGWARALREYKQTRVVLEKELG